MPLALPWPKPERVFFLGGIWLLLALFGYLRPCLAVLPAVALLCGIFCALTYAISRDAAQTSAAAARMLALCVAAIPGLGLAPVCLVRAFSCMHLPRVLTLAMLITFTFFRCCGRRCGRPGRPCARGVREGF